GFSRLLAFEENHSVLRVYYEELVADTESQMRRIFKYLTLPPQALNRDLAIQETCYAKSSFGDNKILAAPCIHTQSIDSYKRIFSKEEIETLLNALGEENFSRLGYTEQYNRACEALKITPSNEIFAQLLEVAEEYAQQRQNRCAHPG